jgi:phosphoglycolate phosphatase-like HAD superfamily hydrolase
MSVFREFLPQPRPLPGAVYLLRHIRTIGIVHGFATSGRRPEIDASLEVLGVGPETVVVERGEVSRAKPEPDLFLACQERLGVGTEDCYVVGDAVWDLLAARRAWMQSVGLLSGVTVRRSWPARARFASTGTPPTCSSRWTRLGNCPERALCHTPSNFLLGNGRRGS